MRIKDAFQKQSAAPSVQSKVNTISAVYYLISSQADVLPVLIEGEAEAGKSRRGISGYSLISRLVENGRSNIQKFLSEPCINSSLILGEVSDSDDLQSVLHTFETTSLGYVIVNGDSKLNQGSILSIRDLLRLYVDGFFSCELNVDQVASSPIFQIDRRETLFRILSEMMRRKVRRVGIYDSNSEFISDSDILKVVFAQAPVAQMGSASWISEQLKKPLTEVKLDPTPWLEKREGVEFAARVLLRSPKGFAQCEAGIVTPWDLVVKPWRLGNLVIRDTIARKASE